MALLQTFNPQSLTSSAKNPNRCSDFSSFAAKHRNPSSGCSSFATKNPNPSSDISFTAKNPNSASNSLLFPATNLNFSCQSPLFSEKCPTCRFPLLSVNHSKLSFSVSAVSNPDQNPKPKRRGRPKKNPAESPENHQECNQNSDQDFPATLPRKPRRGRRSEAVAVEDFVRKSLEKTLSSIREQNAEVLEGKQVLKEEKNENGDDEVEEEQERVGIVEEEDTDWPLDAEVGWGVRASEYFEKHLIQNVVENGVEIDWEGETDDSWVKEINCLEWESFAFHPSPLIVLVFERYNRAADNWKLLKELEKAIKVYWNAKDRLPPRTVKIDINIEKDLAYALKAKECPQLLFFRGNRLLYREKEIRTADELVLMIAHFYYNAKKPSWIDAAAIASPY